MTNTELKQLRKLLFLEVTEAAKLIGECESRTWQRWEKGDRTVPFDVEQTVQMLALSRLEMLKVEYSASDPHYQYFETFDKYKDAGGGGNELKWRLAQSISTQLLCEREADTWRQEEVIND